MELYRQASVGVALSDALDEMVAVRLLLLLHHAQTHLLLLRTVVHSFNHLIHSALVHTS
jgi:hypothetical protein